MKLKLGWVVVLVVVLVWALTQSPNRAVNLIDDGQRDYFTLQFENYSLNGTVNTNYSFLVAVTNPAATDGAMYVYCGIRNTYEHPWLTGRLNYASINTSSPGAALLDSPEIPFNETCGFPANTQTRQITLAAGQSVVVPFEFSVPNNTHTNGVVCEAIERCYSPTNDSLKSSAIAHNFALLDPAPNNESNQVPVPPCVGDSCPPPGTLLVPNATNCADADACTGSGQKMCSGTQADKTCQYTNGTCLAWSTPTSCLAQETCDATTTSCGMPQEEADWQRRLTVWLNTNRDTARTYSVVAAVAALILLVYFRQKKKFRKWLLLLVILAAAAAAYVWNAPPTAELAVTYPHGHGVWLYWSKDPAVLNHTTIDELKARHIETIYFSTVRADQQYEAATYARITDFIGYARTKEMNVFGVIFQDPVFVMKNLTELDQTFRTIIKQQKGLFDGYIIDVEPHTITRLYPQYPAWNASLTNQQFYLTRYVSMANRLSDTAHREGVLFGHTVPVWYHSRLQDVGFDEGLDSMRADFTVLMVYVKDAASVLGRSTYIVQNTTSPLVLGVNIRPGTDPYLPEPQVPLWFTALKAYQADHPLVIGTAFFDSRTVLNQSVTYYAGG